MLDFELLRTFVAVADCGGFHRAAELLNLTQSTVSQQIKRLEESFGYPLLRPSFFFEFPGSQAPSLAPVDGFFRK